MEEYLLQTIRNWRADRTIWKYKTLSWAIDSMNTLKWKKHKLTINKRPNMKLWVAEYWNWELKKIHLPKTNKPWWKV